MSVDVHSRVSRLRSIPNHWFAVAIALALSLLEYDAPFWKDEQVTARFVREMNVLELWIELPQTQPHLPLYYVLVDVWTTFGSMESARVISVAALAVTVLVTHRLARRWFDTTTADIAALFVALSSTMLDTGAWLRMYAPLAAFVVTSWYCFDRARTGDGHWITWEIVTVPVLFMHPFGLLAVFPLVAFGGALQVLEFDGFQTLSFTQSRRAVMLAMLAPAGVVLGKLLGNVGVGTHHQMGHIPRPPGLHVLGFTPAALLFGAPTTVPLLVGAALTTGLIGGAFISQRYQWTRYDLVCLGWVLFPIASLALVSLAKPVYQLKYLTWLTPPLAILTARTITRIDDARWRSALTSLVVVFQLYGVVLFSNGIARANFVFSWWGL